MAHDVDPSGWVNAASGVLLLVLGAFVAWLARREGASAPVHVRRAMLGLALYAVGTGLNFVTSNVLWRADVLGLGAFWVAVVSLGAATAGLGLIAAWFPTPLGAGERRATQAAVLAGGGLLAVQTLLLGPGLADFMADFGVGSPSAADLAVLVASLEAFYVFLAGLVAVLLLLALRWRAAPPGTRGPYVFLSGALVLLPAVAAGRALVGEWGPQGSFGAELGLSTLVPAVALVAVLWLANAAAARGPEGRAARRVAWLALGALAGGMLAGVVGVTWQNGAVRTLSVLLLAYAILRHELLGVQVTLRVAISRSTLAAAFVAVFFVVSEGAQEFFGTTLGSAYLGLAASGALVFAIAPLMRLADRVAERAVPLASPPRQAQAPPGRSPAAAYTHALHLALDDGPMTRDEERHLAELAEHLGLSPREAWALKERVAPGAGGPAARQPRRAA